MSFFRKITGRSKKSRAVRPVADEPSSPGLAATTPARHDAVSTIPREPVINLRLPDELNPSFFLDFDFDIKERFIELAKEEYTETRIFSPYEELLLSVTIDAQGPSQGKAVIQWKQNCSRLWHDRRHSVRILKFQRDEFTGDEEELREKLAGYLYGSLLPWENHGTIEGLRYGQIADGDRLSQAKGISFPKLFFTNYGYSFRLFALYPSFGLTDEPLRGYLIVSKIFLHSCYIAIRNSRGHPSVRGEIYVDGRLADITKNLEVFLRNLRHPTECRILYIRELCIDRSDEAEVDRTLEGDWHALVESSSCGIIDMSSAMELLDDRNLLPEPDKPKKDWHTVPTTVPGPWHSPRYLSKYTPPSKTTNLTDEDIASWPDYEYIPLDLAAREIRLLNIYAPGSPTDPICVRVCHSPMYSEHRYQALSYSWGSSEITRYIRDDSTKIGVTENLYGALVQLRSMLTDPGNYMVVWIDAICIDQNRPAEPSRHIPRMHEIYYAAMRVDVSVAPQVPELAVMLMQDHFARQDLTALYEVDKQGNETGRLKDSRECRDAWADLYRFLRLPYFGRRWIVQEIACATEPMVVLGSGRFRAVRMMSIAAWFLHNNFTEILAMWRAAKHVVIGEFEELRQVVAPEKRLNQLGIDAVNQCLQKMKTLDYIREFRAQGDEMTFLFLAILTQNAECTDPRDTLYSLWNIARERNETSQVLRGYDSDIETVFERFSQNYMLHTGSLDLMCLSQDPLRIPRTVVKTEHEQLRLPSWCPDYRLKGFVSSLIRCTVIHHDDLLRARRELDVAPYHADLINADDRPSMRVRHLNPFSFTNDKNLIAHGVIADTIRFVSSYPDQDLPSITLDDLISPWSIDLIGQLLSMAMNKTPDADRNKVLNSLQSDLVSMMCGEMRGTAVVEYDLAKGEAFQLWDRSKHSQIVSLATRIASFVRGRRLVITEGGYMGLAPWYASVGMKIAVICGCSVPVLLVPLESEIEQTIAKLDVQDEEKVKVTTWRFAGDVCVQGWMEGEIMKEYGKTTQEVWDAFMKDEYAIQIS